MKNDPAKPATRPLLDVKVLTEQEKEEALARARRKMADQWASAQLGMAPPDGMTTPQGPAPIEGEEMCPITILLAEFTPRITLDGVPYLHGHTYTVTKRVYETLTEIMGRTHEHQRIVDGKNVNAYRREQDIRIRGN